MASVTVPLKLILCCPSIDLIVTGRPCCVLGREKIERERAVALRMALYQALWQKGSDIEHEHVCAEILQQQGLGSVSGQELEAAEASLHRWQREWESCAYDSRIPTVIRGMDTLADNEKPLDTENKLLGLASNNTLQDFINGKKNHYRGESLCGHKTRQRIFIGGRIDLFGLFWSQCVSSKIYWSLSARAIYLNS